jgi:hypothetical protein
MALPDSVYNDGIPAGSLDRVEPVVTLIFDEDTGEFVGVNRNLDNDTDGAGLMPMDEFDTDSGSEEDSDWIVYSTSASDNSDTGLTNDIPVSTDTSLLIDWDAEADDLINLIPPPPPGRSGMRHGALL